MSDNTLLVSRSFDSPGTVELRLEIAETPDRSPSEARLVFTFAPSADASVNDLDATTAQDVKDLIREAMDAILDLPPGNTFNHLRALKHLRRARRLI